MKTIFEYFKSKNFKFGFVALIMTVAVMGIVAIVNIIAAGNNFKWDLTPNNMYSIGDTTHKLLEGLNKDVEIVFLIDRDFVKDGENGFLVAEFLEKYEKYPRVKVQYVDPDKNPDIISRLNKDGVLSLKEQDIAVKCGDRIKIIKVEDIFQYSDQYYESRIFIGEQSITGAIKYVTSDVIPTVYFLDGHGEKSLDTEYSVIKQILEGSSYAVKKVNLTLEEKIPEDSEVLISAAPQMDLTSTEKDKIIDYLKKGGNAIFLMEPVNVNKKFTNFESVLEKYNIGMNYDKVKENDSNRHVPQNEYEIVPDIAKNDITANIEMDNFFVVIPESRSFRVLDNEESGLTVGKFLTATSTAEGVPFGGEGERENMKGPLDLALVAQNSSTNNSKVVVLGNAYFATDAAIESYAYAQNTVRLLLNSIVWMHDDSNDLIIMPKTPQMDRMTVTGTQGTTTILIGIFGIPLLLIIMGIFIWLRRRHL